VLVTRPIKLSLPGSLGVLVASIVISCSPLDPVAPSLKDLDTRGPSCSSACDHQVQLGCDVGRPTPSGASCQEVCANATSSGYDWPLQCLDSALECDVCD